MTTTVQAEVSSGGGTSSTFFAALQAALEKALDGRAGAPVVAILSGGQGDFAYNYLDANLNFNLWTYEWISARAAPTRDADAAELSGAGSFPAAWGQLLDQMFYQLSRADAEALSNAQTVAAREQTNVVLTYVDVYGRITGEQRAAAAAQLGYVPQPFDYVVAYVVGTVWYGQSPPLSYTAMLDAPALAPLLHAMPANGCPVVAAVQLYLQALGGNVAAIQSAFNAGYSLLAQLRASAANPSAGTTGMTTVDPLGAPSPVVPAYFVGRSSKQIAADLAGSDTISFTFEYEPPDDDALVDGTGGEPVLLFVPAEGAAMAMESMADSRPATILVTYTGYSVVPVDPDTSWYRQSVLDQAFVNWNLGPAAPSGLTFHGVPLFTVAPFPTGTFNRLETIVVSNYPTVTMTYPGTPAAVLGPLAAGLSGELFLFSTRLAPAAVSYALNVVADAQPDAAAIFTPVVSAVPFLAQQAPVIGAVVGQ